MKTPAGEILLNSPSQSLCGVSVKHQITEAEAHVGETRTSLRVKKKYNVQIIKVPEVHVPDEIQITFSGHVLQFATNLP